MMTKIIKIVGIVVILGVAGYFGMQYFSKNSSAPASGLVSSNQSASPDQTAAANADTSGASDINNQFVSVLLNMRNIGLDDKIFTAASFKALQDFSNPITPEQNPGRPNPFAPVGQDALVSKTFSVATSPVTDITASGVTLNGTLPAGTTATERWFEWGITQTTPLPNVTTKVSQSLSLGTFSYALTGLSPQTTYYVRSVAKVGGATTVYGEIVSFKTLAK